MESPPLLLRFSDLALLILLLRKFVMWATVYSKVFCSIPKITDWFFFGSHCGIDHNILSSSQDAPSSVFTTGSGCARDNHRLRSERKMSFCIHIALQYVPLATECQELSCG